MHVWQRQNQINSKGELVFNLNELLKNSPENSKVAVLEV